MTNIIELPTSRREPKQVSPKFMILCGRQSAVYSSNTVYYYRAKTMNSKNFFKIKFMKISC